MTPVYGISTPDGVTSAPADLLAEVDLAQDLARTEARNTAWTILAGTPSPLRGRLVWIHATYAQARAMLALYATLAPVRLHSDAAGPDGLVHLALGTPRLSAVPIAGHPGYWRLDVDVREVQA